METATQHPLQRALVTGVPAIGTFVMEFATRGMPWIARNAGLDFLVYDTEHGSLSRSEVRDGVLGTRAAGLSPIVRVRGATRSQIGPVLDAGALGVIIPMTERPEDVADAVEYSRYHPDGSRGAAMGLPFHFYDARPPVEVMAEANESVLVIPQVETVAGLDAIDEICAVDGVGMVWVGHGDLAQSMGIPGQFGDPSLIDAMARIADVAAAHGLAAGRLIASADDAGTWIERGYSVLSVSADIRLLTQALADSARVVRAAGGASN